MLNPKMEVTLNAEQLRKFNEMKRTRSDKTDQELLAQVIDRGLYDLCYRTKRNKEQWQQFKAWKQPEKQNS